MSILKKPYEISIWDDVLVFDIKYVDENKGEIIVKGITPNEAKKYSDFTNYSVEKQYYKEKKIAIIGSNTMSAPWRAVNSSFVKNVNGSSTLTFTMYSKYYDEDKDELLDNPFVKKMVNERKVKLKYDGEWYDFIIKSIQESSDNKTYTYTAKDLFINELSKTGYDLVFDTELKNNIGTVTKLGKEILEGSDWTLKENNDILRQYKEEPLYSLKVTKSFVAKDMLDGTSSIAIEAGKIIYGFYYCVNERTSFFQFLYRENDDYETDDDRVILNSPNYYVDGVIFSINSNKDEIKTNYFEIGEVISDYRGKRLVRKIKTEYDPIMDKYVSVYKDGDKTVYGYTDYEYITSTFVKNYVTNPTQYTSTDGWDSEGESNLQLITDPDIRNLIIPVEDYSTYLKWVNKNRMKNFHLINHCIRGNATTIGSFSENEQYVFKFKYKVKVNDEIKAEDNNSLKFEIAEYNLNDGNYSIVENSTIFSTTAEDTVSMKVGEYWQYKVSCKKNVSRKDLLEKKYALIISSTSTGEEETTYFFEDVQFFKYIENNNEKMVSPGEEINAEAKIKYFYYYKPTEEITDESQVSFIYQGYEPSPNYSAEYEENYEKQRSIQASESNRFNLIQSLCETFECWAKFEIEHNKNTGEILIDENGRQKKWVSFHEYIGNDNHIGFKYGINLKSIQRTIDSEAIATKLIVKNNSNEYADGGFCSIATASENPTGENFLLDFSHYINQGLLNFSQFNNDLYLESSGYLGYYKHLRDKNKEIEKNAKLQAELISKTLPNLRSQYSTYKVAIESGKKQEKEQLDEIYKTTGLTLDQLLSSHKDSNWWQDDGIYSLILSTIRLKKNIKEYEKLFEVVKNSLYGENWKEDGTGELGGAEKKQEDLEEEIERLTEEKRKEHQKFYQKYSRYIQEGSWISEDYIDDNLYYLDAESTLHTSSQPKVTYTINVLELSQVEGFEYYQFNVGDKTFIEDTEFFGWVDQIHSTPYKEEVVVSEVKVALDDPTQNTITVKNYKTQFEDLFQRITATTTSVQFSTGEYQRAAGVVEADGSLSASAVQNSIFNNSIILSNSNNESVIWDETGITTTSINKPNEMVRIVGGGIFLSKDFGTSWSTGITGSGINANFINAGQIDTNLVRIMNGSYPTFRWDSSGLSAYYFYEDEKGVTNYSQSKFVRLDQFGLYGINSDSAFNVFTPDKDGLVGEDKIKKHSHFYLTWSGFGIRTESGAVSITSKDDIEVKDNSGNTRIKIGLLNNGNHGMQLFDSKGKTTLETDGSGQLYLKDIIKIGPSIYNPRVVLGSSGYYDKNGALIAAPVEDGYSKIFSVMDRENKETIAFYDNGQLVAKNATIGGVLEANTIISGDCVISDSSLSIGEVSKIAEGLNLEVDGAGLKFSGDGLVVSNYGNAGIRIEQLYDVYALTTDTEIEPEKEYYILNSDTGTYTLVENPDISYIEQYYEKRQERRKVFEADASGNGYFSGEIEATSGTLGNIILKDGALYYQEGDEILFSLSSAGLVANEGSLGNLEITGQIIGGSDSKNPGFIFDGENGSIIAKTIELGNAKLLDYLRIGDDCWIFNPDAYISGADINHDSNWNKSSFINVNYKDGDTIKTAIAIQKDGIIQLNSNESPKSIIINSKEGYISSSDINKNTYWRIDENSAIFNNIVARGSIQCSVFEYGEVQAVGGILVIRPSSIIDTVETLGQNSENKSFEYKLGLRNSEQFTVGDYCQVQVGVPVTKQKAQEEGVSYVVKITYIDKNTGVITIESISEITIDIVGASFISFGNRTSAEDKSTTSYGIGLNASDVDSLVPQRSLSLVDFYYNSATNGINAENKIILGYIPNDENLYGSIANSYGLFADNVLVRGKLISDTGSGVYSGIDSLSNIDAPYSKDNIILFPGATPGKIILWAGATDNTDIADAPFWVDSRGNMFAGSGYFEGAIISKSTITASEIKTAIITGMGDESKNYALKIRNNNGSTSNAIKFYEQNEGNETVYFTLTSAELAFSSNDKQTSITTSGVTSPAFITKDGISVSKIIKMPFKFEDGTQKYISIGKYKNTDSETCFGILVDTAESIKLDSEIITIFKELSIQEKLSFWDKVIITKASDTSNAIIGFDIEFKEE